MQTGSGNEDGERGEEKGVGGIITLAAGGDLLHRCTQDQRSNDGDEYMKTAQESQSLHNGSLIRDRSHFKRPGCARFVSRTAHRSLEGPVLSCHVEAEQ